MTTKRQQLWFRSRPWAALLALLVPAQAGCTDEIYFPDDPPPNVPGADAGADASPVPDPNPLPDDDDRNEHLSSFDLGDFERIIQPDLLASSCAVSGCHDPEWRGYADFVLFPDPGPGSNQLLHNFREVASRVDLTVLPFSATGTALYQYATDNHGGRQIGNVDALRRWIEDAYERYSESLPAFYFDALIFEQQIQPMLDGPEASCTAAACHGLPNGAARFSLHPNPTPGSLEMTANLRAVASLVDLTETRPENTVFYMFATNRHLNMQVPDPILLASWIDDALRAARGE